MDIKAATVQKAIAMLRAAGAQFAVLFGEQKFGELEIAAPVTATKRTRRPDQYEWVGLYAPWLESAKPGSVFQHDTETREAADSLRASLGSRLSAKFGPGSAMSSVSKTQTGFRAEFIVISDNKAQYREQA